MKEKKGETRLVVEDEEGFGGKKGFLLVRGRALLAKGDGLLRKIGGKKRSERRKKLFMPQRGQHRQLLSSSPKKASLGNQVVEGGGYPGKPLARSISVTERLGKGKKG